MSGSFKPNPQGIRDIQRQLDREFAKHPVTVPVQAATPRGLPVSAGVTRRQQPIEHHYHGDVLIVSGGQGVQVAMNATNVSQVQDNAKPVQPKYEALVRLLDELLPQFAQQPMDPVDRETAEESAREVLAEVIAAEPNKSRIRRAMTAIRGALTPLALAAAKGAGSEIEADAGQWAHHAIESIGALLS